MTFRVSDEGYSRKASCELNLISTFFILGYKAQGIWTCERLGGYGSQAIVHAHVVLSVPLGTI